MVPVGAYEWRVNFKRYNDNEENEYDKASRNEFLIKKRIDRDMKKKYNDKPEFSKRLLLQESMLIWIITISFIILAFVCVANQYFGELPWLAAMCGFPWTAYGASQAFYFRKAEKENTQGGIKYETVMADIHPYITPDQFDKNANG